MATFFGVKPGDDKDTLSLWFYWGTTEDRAGVILNTGDF